MTKHEYRDSLAEALAARDAHLDAAGEDEESRKAAILAFNEWDAAARAERADSAEEGV